MSTGYRPPSKEPRGAWARHLHAFRRREGWSQTHAFDQWREGLGLGERSRSAYISIDMGIRQPKPHEAAYLVSVVGEVPDVEPEPTEEPTLASALLALAQELREAREERQELAAEVVALRGVVSLLAKRSGVALPEQLAPRA